MSARFCGTGSCVTDYVMDNDGVAELVETSERDDRVHGE